MKNAVLYYIIEKLVIRLLSKISSALPDLIKQWIEKKKTEHREKEQAAAQKEVDTVLANPEATAEEKAKAYAKLTNAGRF